jgi:hypothetical protein
MKNPLMLATVLSALLLAGVAHSAPLVGDRAVYIGKSVTGSGTQKQESSFRLSREVLRIDLPGSRVLERITTTPGTTEERWIELDQFISDETLTQVVSNCPQYGRPDRFQTPAGAFDVCGVPVDGPEGFGQWWIAQVPYAIVRSLTISRDGLSETTLELESYSKGTL